jgi:hypothetical protein
MKDVYERTHRQRNSIIPIHKSLFFARDTIKRKKRFDFTSQISSHSNVILWVVGKSTFNLTHTHTQTQTQTQTHTYIYHDLYTVRMRGMEGTKTYSIPLFKYYIFADHFHSGVLFFLPIPFPQTEKATIKTRDYLSTPFLLYMC